MAGKQIELAGQVFLTQDAARKRIQAMLGGYRPGQTVNAFDSALLADLVQRHPSAAHKIGSGIAGFRVEKNPEYPGAKCFILLRTDGTRTDFSYTECLRQTPHKQKVTSAFRGAIDSDILKFKQAQFDAAGGRLHCPITGEPLQFAGTHVDHVPPDTFANLLADFLTGEGVDLAELAVKPSADNTYSDRLCDAALESRWIEFHRFNAVLRVVSRTANQLIIPRQVTP